VPLTTMCHLLAFTQFQKVFWESQFTITLYLCKIYQLTAFRCGIRGGYAEAVNFSIDFMNRMKEDVFIKMGCNGIGQVLNITFNFTITWKKTFLVFKRSSLAVW